MLDGVNRQCLCLLLFLIWVVVKTIHIQAWISMNLKQNYVLWPYVGNSQGVVCFLLSSHLFYSCRNVFKILHFFMTVWHTFANNMFPYSFAHLSRIIRHEYLQILEEFYSKSVLPGKGKITFSSIEQPIIIKLIQKSCLMVMKIEKHTLSLQTLYLLPLLVSRGMCSLWLALYHWNEDFVHHGLSHTFTHRGITNDIGTLRLIIFILT